MAFSFHNQHLRAGHSRQFGTSPLLLSLIVAAPAIGNILRDCRALLTTAPQDAVYRRQRGASDSGLFLLMLFVTAPAPFVLIVVTHWLIVSLSITGYVEVIRTLSGRATRRTMAYHRVGFTACATVMTPLFGQLLDAWSYQVLFPFAALFGVLSGVTFGQVTYKRKLQRRGTIG